MKFNKPFLINEAGTVVMLKALVAAVFLVAVAGCGSTGADPATKHVARVGLALPDAPPPPPLPDDGTP